MAADDHSGSQPRDKPELIAALQTEDTYSTLRLVLLGEAYLTSGDLVHARQYLEQARNRARSEGPPQLLAEIDEGFPTSAFANCLTVSS